VNAPQALATTPSDVRPPSPPASWKTRLRRYRLIIGMMFLIAFAVLGLALRDKYNEVSYQRLVRDLGRQGVKVNRYTEKAEWTYGPWGRKVPRFFSSCFDTHAVNVEVQGKTLTPEALKQVFKLPGLKHLMFHKTACVDREAMELIAQAHTLVSLHLIDDLVTDESLQLLGELPRLVSIYVESPLVTEASLDQLRMFKQIQSIGLRVPPEKLQSMQLQSVEVRSPSGSTVLRVGDVPTFRVTLKTREPLLPIPSVYIRSVGTGWSTYLNSSGLLTRTPAGLYEVVCTAGGPCEHPARHEVQITLILSGKPLVQLVVGTASFVVEEKAK
jgi:hypothetical protein